MLSLVITIFIYNYISFLQSYLKKRNEEKKLEK